MAKKQKKTAAKEKKQPQKKENIGRDTDISKELKSIYTQGEKEMPNLKELEVKKRSTWRALVFIVFPILAVISLVAWAGVFFFQSRPSFTGSGVSLEIEAPFSATAFDPIRYQVLVANNEESPITDTELVVRLPKNFTFTSTNPAFKILPEDAPKITNAYTWELDRINPGSEKRVTIEGYLFGAVNSIHTTSATVSYVPQAFTSTFEENAVFSTEINDTPLETEILSERQVADGEESRYLISIKNTGGVPIETIYAKLNDSRAFTLEMFKQITFSSEDNEIPTLSLHDSETTLWDDDFTPHDPDNDLPTWTIEQLEPDATALILITGTYTVEDTVNEPFILTVTKTNQTDEEVPLGEISSEIEVIKGELITQLIISGNQEDAPIDFGQKLNYLIRLQNKSSSTLGNISVRALIDSPILDWGSLSDTAQGTVSKPSISWTAEEIPELAVLLPGSTIEIPFSMNVLEYNEISRNISPENYRITSTVNTEVSLIDNIETEKEFDSPTIQNKVNTNLTLDAQARYFDENENTIGSGPLPPQVGKTTTYVIYWTLRNEINEIKDITVSAQLSDSTRFNSIESVGAGTMKHADGTVTWTLNRMPTSVEEVTSSFSITLTPESDDIDKILTLLGQTTAVATDTVTGGTIKKIDGSLTTNLDEDPNGSGQGLVQEAQ